MQLLFASRNRGKVAEVSGWLRYVANLEVLSLDGFEGVPDVVEDAPTFEGNAIKKARELGDLTGLWTLGDDSGLEVDALDGAPGIYSARYAGEHGNDAKNRAKLLDALADTPDDRRTARFRCVLALYSPQLGTVELASGTCEGRIARQERGSFGFGYDPIFVPDGYDRTFAELGPEDREQLSHRARALRAIRERILAQLG